MEWVTRIGCAVAFTCCTLAVRETALAHGDPPQALSVVATDRGEASVVRLNEGLARRSSQGWHYLCPALWGDDAVVPADSLPGGPVVIGASSGLFVADDSGTVTRHPDPAAEGRVIALGAAASGLFALRVAADGRHQVLRVEAERIETIFSTADVWGDMAVGEDFIELVRLQAGRVHEQRLNAAGEVLQQGDAELPPGSSAVFARMAGDQAYVVVLSSSALLELGRVEQGAWVSLQKAITISGPTQIADGGRFIALDNALARFDEERALPLEEPARITCLRRRLDLDYACSDDGLRRLQREGLAESLFELQALQEPDLEAVPEAERLSCELQWRRYEIDLRAAGIEPPAIDAGVTDASVADAAIGVDRDAGEDRPRRRGGGGCDLAGPGSRAQWRWPRGLVLAAGLAWLRRRARRRR